MCNTMAEVEDNTWVTLRTHTTMHRCSSIPTTTERSLGAITTCLSTSQTQMLRNDSFKLWGRFRSCSKRSTGLFRQRMYTQASPTWRFCTSRMGWPTHTRLMRSRRLQGRHIKGAKAQPNGTLMKYKKKKKTCSGCCKEWAWARLRAA